MSIMPILGAILPKALDLIDKAVPDKAQAALIKSDLTSSILKNEAEFTKAAASAVLAEAQGESWLQRNWRPITMLWFIFLISAFWFGFVPVGMDVALVEKMFDIVMIGLGGYVFGRSAEKVAKEIAPSLRK